MIGGIGTSGRFIDGATVQTETLVEQDIPIVGQGEETYDCLPANVESIDRSFGGNLTKDKVRGWYPDTDPNRDPLKDGEVWSAYRDMSRHSVTGERPRPGVYSPVNVLSNMQNGSRVSINLDSGGGDGHSVVMQSILKKTITKLNGNVVYKNIYKVMNPSYNGFIETISEYKIINALNIFYIHP